MVVWWQASIQSLGNGVGNGHTLGLNEVRHTWLNLYIPILLLRARRN